MTDVRRRPAVREELARIEESWRRLNTELDRIPRDRMLEPGAVGDRPVKDLLRHIAFSDAEAVAVGSLHLAGEADPNTDVESISQRQAAKRGGRSLDEPLAEPRHADRRPAWAIGNRAGRARPLRRPARRRARALR